MSTPTISLRGFWMYAWCLWITALMAWLLWGPVYGHDTLTMGLRVLFTVFWPMELIGSLVTRRTEGQELATTLSQVIQRVAQMGHDSDYSAWYKGFDALVTGFTLLVSFAAGLAFWPVHPVVGILFGLTVFCYCLFHWLKRWRYG